MKIKSLGITCLMAGVIGFAPLMSNNSCLGMIQVEASSTNTGKVSTEESGPTFSKYWFQDTRGDWKVKDAKGNIIKNAWLCDDAVATNGDNVWYLLDKNGNMVTAGLVQDPEGKYYSLETSHNGYYGMLRYKSDTYDGIKLQLNDKHDGYFAQIQNKKGLEGLKEKYGITKISIPSSNCVYTSKFEEGVK